ncbi:MAG: adenylosuccinate synthase [Candidatus Eisenbacteria sp.]|nr:adenylosuccinate synthase [Candidatus Eisenbacteria bacterium]
MSVRVVVGLQWGDEGKGKVVDYLARDADYIVRYQGGANAGHTVKVEDRIYVFHLIPSGILHPSGICVIGNGVVVDPESLVEEIAGLESQGIDVCGRLRISHAAHLVLPVHRLLDQLYESSRDAPRIGTTGRGIGPAYSDKAGRVGIRMVDLLDEKSLEAKLTALLGRHRAVLAGAPNSPPGVSDLLQLCRGYHERLAPLISDVSAIINRAIDQGKSVLLEGAQGAHLDVDHGTYPYVTSSSTVAGGAPPGCGIGPARITGVIGIAKAYTTRVGEGPFPTELEGPEARHLKEKGREFGATTGRPRRCGWFDLLAVRRSAMINGVSELVITKIDVLDGLPSLKICVGYRTGDGLREQFPMEPWFLQDCQPLYREFDGWGPGETSGGRLPSNARKYLDFISGELDIPIRLVSAGMGRADVIIL